MIEVGQEYQGCSDPVNLILEIIEVTDENVTYKFRYIDTTETGEYVSLNKVFLGHIKKENVVLTPDYKRRVERDKKLKTIL